MGRRFSFSLIITRRTLVLCTAIVLCGAAVLFGPPLLLHMQRVLYGVKPGVTLEGFPVGGLLEHELYDVIASLSENHYIEARNAAWDWKTDAVQPEQVGQVVDVKATVAELLAAAPNTRVAYVMVQILPSITSKHFQVYRRGPETDPAMALMVNVDWGDEYIEPMLAIFSRYGVSATWFLTGRWVKRAPETARKIGEAGHEIGNHGGWHGMPTEMGRDEVRRFILEGEDILIEATGQKPTLFAPPGGDHNRQSVAVAAELGYKTVLWTIDTVDWQRPAPTTIIDRVLGKASNGALVLMHPTQPTVEALPIIIDQLLQRGFRLVTVGELLAD
ncbi:MAG: polysaccharide deacetylase family protein [Limnochordia bacterium]|jgi:probable sporulation protein (polysaccharide deacetylase family)